ncbi:FUSC family protein [Streptomyces sp. URMC 123]|uniref:FUSC family protein n=1 Tax=Streptomyces sp. URMC 123 TaxID=3423403 RepID=UPI003F1B2B66
MPGVTNVVDLAWWRHDTVAAQTVRCTVASVLAFAAALWLTDEPAPLLAPLTALLVVQVSLYATLTSGLRRVVSVVAGVLIASAFSALVGMSWWSLGLLILASLVLGHLLRVDEFVPEVAISAMLVLGVAHVAQTAWGRVAETLIGAVTGVMFNAFVAPPVLVQPAGEAIEDLAGRMRALLKRIGREVDQGATRDQAANWLFEARAVDNDIARVDAALNRADESMRLNPRVRQGMLTRIVLRSGLDTLEICAVVLRTLCRSMTDLSTEREGQRVYSGEVATALGVLCNHLADAVDSFGRLITAQVSANAEQAEEELAHALSCGREDRQIIAGLLVAEREREPERWELHGALLANIDRLLNELDTQKRSQWLAEELDRVSQLRPPRRTPLHRAVGRLQALVDRVWGRRRPGF